jgi:uncharacterized membrane protein (DUF2068 family)
VKSAHAIHHHAPIGLRTVAVFEFAKGLIVLVAGLGLLSLIHRDAQAVAEDIVMRLHMNPAHFYPRIFIQFASNLTDARLWFMSLGALAYAGVRFIETFGLWHERAWAEWFAVISAGLYLPVELWHLYDKPGPVSFSLPLINIGIIIYLARLLAINARRRQNCGTDS